MEWLYLVIASVLEVGWIFSLKELSFAAIRKLSIHSFFEQPLESFWCILPLIGYIILGLGNIYFFSLAMKQISASTAFAIWMAITLAGVKFIEVLFYKESIRPSDYIFLTLLLVAIIGLKKNS
jgi:quaternary ammonium compound-resistance protein SugE